MDAFIATLAQLFALIRKELLAVVKDPANRVILFVPALLQSVLFGYGATYDLTHVPYAVLDQSRSAASVELLAHLDGTGVFKREATLSSTRQIAEAIDDQQVLLVLSIPADFADRLAAGQRAPLQLILDGRNSTTAGSAAGHVNAVVTTFNQSLGAAPGIRIERRAWFNPNLESRWGMMPNLIAALSMIQTLLIAALSVAREREQGTFDQLLVTPLTPMLILIGKALPAIFIGIIQSSIVFLIIRFWFGIPMNGSVARAAIGGEVLHDHHVVPGGQHRFHRPAGMAQPGGSGEHGKRADADGRHRQRHGKAARRGQRHPHPGEGAGAGGDHDPVDRGESEAGPGHHLRNHGGQTFRMSPAHRLREGRDLAVGGAQRHRAAVEGSVESEEMHGVRHSMEGSTRSGGRWPSA